MRGELGFEKGRQTATAKRSAVVTVLPTSNLSLGALAGAVADVVGKWGGVVSGLFNEP